MRAIRTIVWLLLGAAGAAGASCGATGGLDSAGDPGGDSGGALPGCLASNECPTGWTCNDFHTCMPPAPGSDGGVPAETEIELGAPTSSQRYVYVAMTAQNELARIDGETLAVSSTPVGAAPREVATIPGSDGAVVLDSASGTATVVRPVLTGGDGTRACVTTPSLT
jgi:hypothetical protein